MTISKVSLALGIAVALALCARPALAAPEVCVFNVVSGVSFGNYDVLSPVPTLMNGTISYTCSNIPAAGEVVNISLSRGNAPTYAPRYMINGAQHLNYNLYLDAGLTIIWGNGTGGTSKYSQVTKDGVLTAVTIFGSIPASQDVSAGSYTDTIKVTMTW